MIQIQNKYTVSNVLLEFKNDSTLPTVSPGADRSIWERRRDLQGAVFSLVFQANPSQDIWSYANENGTFSGVLADLLSALESLLNFKINATASHVSDYGSEMPNNSFTGFAGMLQRRQVDIVATDMSVTYQRARVFDFSLPYDTISLRIAIKTPGSDLEWWTYLKG